MKIHRANILVVDDDDLVRHGLTVILRYSGYEVRCACDGVDALAEIRAQLPDIVISDLNMPRMSGFELLPAVRHRFPTVWIIAMSSAFSGTAMPAGVTADAFHEKGDSMGSMLLMVKTFAERKGRQAPVMAANFLNRDSHEPNPTP
jgi:DNA-binding response OmpR family regulator